MIKKAKHILWGSKGKRNGTLHMQTIPGLPEARVYGGGVWGAGRVGGGRGSTEGFGLDGLLDESHSICFFVSLNLFSPIHSTSKTFYFKHLL